MASVAFSEHFDHLVRSLERLTTVLPATAIMACERTLDVAGDELGDIRTRRAAAGRDLITVVLRLYRQGDAELRNRCLDVIDRLTDSNAFGVTEALEAER
jgi:hypothetical protein